MKATLLVQTVVFTISIGSSSSDGRGLLSFVVNRGCPYLTHYVRDNYFPYIPGAQSISTTVSTGDINWVTYTVNAGVDNYIPSELINGLIDCGKTYALYGVNAPDWLLKALNVDITQVPGVIG